MFEYDSGLALIHLEDAQTLYRMEDQVSGRAPEAARPVSGARRWPRDLLRQLAADVYVTDWTRSHANFFRAVQIEKNMMFIILLLIVAVAAFNIVSTLVMAVTDKQADIAILRTLGAAPAGIMAMFIVQGALIGVIGTLLGRRRRRAARAQHRRVVPFIERLFARAFLAKDVYYISELPSSWNGAMSSPSPRCRFVLACWRRCIRAGARRACNPAEALRYE